MILSYLNSPLIKICLGYIVLFKNIQEYSRILKNTFYVDHIKIKMKENVTEIFLIYHYRNEILFFGFYRYVNSGESLTN